MLFLTVMCHLWLDSVAIGSKEKMIVADRLIAATVFALATAK